MISSRRWAVLLATFILSALGHAPALAAGAQNPVVYLLGKNSTFQRGCFAPCLCPVMEQGSVRGRFVLRPAGSDGLFDYFDVQGVSWIVTVPNGTIRVQGSGTYRMGGEFAMQQQLTLDLSLDGQAPQRFDSGLVVGGSEFPVIDLPISLHGMVCFDTAFFIRAHPAIDMRATDADLSWLPAPPGMSYDLVIGDLAMLNRTGGNFAASTLACLTHEDSAAWYPLDVDPPVGSAYWYLVRAASPGGPGTYDSDGVMQEGPRDPGIEASGTDCP